jgi:putative SOS response-associated peptidase YedK
MCKHYDEGDEAILAFVCKTSPWIRIPDAFSEAPAHMYPKRKGRIVRRCDSEPELVLMRWGVWPFYQKKEKPELVTNARSETLLQKRLWKDSAARRRCLIPAAGYFEAGLGPVGARGEVRVKIKDRAGFFMAGLWDHDPGDTGECGFTLITTEPNELVRPYNDRMPVLLSDAEAQAWIGDEPLPESRLAELCRTFPAEHLILEEIAVQPREKLVIQRPAKKPPEQQPQQQQLLF